MMKIIKKIIVKQIVTEKSKQQLFHKYEQQIQQFTKEIAQLQFELKKNEKHNKGNVSAIRRAIEKEIENRKEKCKIIQFQIQQLQILPLGTELKETEVEEIIEINEGDNWDELMKHRSIVIKDGVIVEIT